MVGRDAIEGILDVLEPLATTHAVTNPRVTFDSVDDGRAHLEALVEAQHVDRERPARHLLLKNLYDVTAVRDGQRFVIESMEIRTIWSDGDPAVLFGEPATPPGPSAIHVTADALSWIDTGGGTSLAPLRFDGTGAGAALLRFSPGGRAGLHRHPAGEDLYVISGTLRVGDRLLRTGDFLHTPPGGVHDAEAEEEAVVLVSVPEPIELVE